jgi:hypothetical protein
VTRWTLPFLATVLAIPALAQDPFEIQVYEYETVKQGLWDLETHLNYVGKGSKVWEGTQAPTNNQFHTTFELTHGITDHFEFAGYFLLAHIPGANTPIDYAGARIRPRYSVPESAGLPFRLSIGGEVDFAPSRYNENTISMEIRPVLEKAVGRWQFDFNPAFGRALRGPGTSDGWEFEPAARIAFQATKRFQPSLEYYGGIGPVKNVLPASQQIHQLYPGIDVTLSESAVVNVGVGIATTPAGDQLIIKTRWSFEFGKKRH